MKVKATSLVITLDANDEEIGRLQKTLTEMDYIVHQDFEIKRNGSWFIEIYSDDTERMMWCFKDTNAIISQLSLMDAELWTLVGKQM